MRVLEAVARIRSGRLALDDLWSITTRPERVQVALILGLPAELPIQASTPDLAWKALNLSQRRAVLKHAPAAIRARLPDDPAIGRRVVWQRRVVTVEAHA
jgi:hypothetical protein